MIIDDCISRIAENDCPKINDRVTCLTSKMSISYEWKGVQVKGSDCVWSRVEKFNLGAKLPCEPRVVVEAEGESNFETCIHGNYDF